MFNSIEEQNNLQGRVIPLTRLLRKPDVLKLIGLGRTKLDEMVSQGTFPKPVKITGKSVGWVDAEVQEWIEERIRARG